MAGTDPDRFTDRKFLKRADEQLNREKAGIVVVRNGRITFHSPLVDLPHLDERLRELSRSRIGARGGSRSMNDSRWKSMMLTFSDGAEGAVYVFSDIRWFVENGTKFFPLLLLSLLLVIGSTNGILTFLVSRSLIKPLSLLKAQRNGSRMGIWIMRFVCIEGMRSGSWGWPLKRCGAG